MQFGIIQFPPDQNGTTSTYVALPWEKVSEFATIQLYQEGSTEEAGRYLASSKL